MNIKVVFRIWLWLRATDKAGKIESVQRSNRDGVCLFIGLNGKQINRVKHLPGIPSYCVLSLRWFVEPASIRHEIQIYNDLSC